MLARVDSFLLDKAQKFCDRFQRLTGFTKFRIEKWMVIIIALTMCLSIAINPDAFGLLSGPLLVWFVISEVREIELAERSFFRNNVLRPHVMNFALARGFMMCLQSILVLVCTLSIVYETAEGILPALAFSLSAACWTYISPCVPRPPSKSKMREWLEKGLQELNSLLPEPAPIRVPAISD